MTGFSKIDNMRWAVDIPQWFDLRYIGDEEVEWKNVAYFQTEKEAVEFCQTYFGADDKGNINLITSL